MEGVPLLGNADGTLAPALKFLCGARALTLGTATFLGKLGLFAGGPLLKGFSGGGWWWRGGQRGRSHPTWMLLEGRGRGGRHLRGGSPPSGGFKAQIVNAPCGGWQGLVQFAEEARSLEGEGLCPSGAGDRDLQYPPHHPIGLTVLC